ncbi:MAG: hypothetical protein ACRCZ2_09230 [Fusobacteriaceae bacterium]
MKMQKMNPNNMNPMEMNNASAMMGMMNVIQKIGKGKRKYSVSLDKNEKKFLGKFLEEGKKQFDPSVPGSAQMKPVAEFFDYMIGICNSSNKNDIRFSFEELEFFKKMLSDSVKGMEGMNFKWYQLIRKSMAKVMVKQYRALLKKIN